MLLAMDTPGVREVVSAARVPDAGRWMARRSRCFGGGRLVDRVMRGKRFFSRQNSKKLLPLGNNCYCPLSVLF